MGRLYVVVIWIISKIQVFYIMSQKSVCYLVFYNLKKLEPIFIIFGSQYPNNPSL